MNRASFAAAGILALMLGGATVLEAGVGILSEESSGRDQVSYNQWLATAISLNEGDDVEIQSITIRARTVVPNANVYVGIVGSQSQRPFLDTTFVVFDTTDLANAVVSQTSIDYTFAPLADQDDPPPLLPAGSMYWIVFGISGFDFEQTPSTGLYEWDYTNSTGPFAEDNGLSIANMVATSGTVGANWDPIVVGPQIFHLEFVPVIPVPEPSACFLMMAGLIGFGFSRRRS